MCNAKCCLINNDDSKHTTNSEKHEEIVRKHISHGLTKYLRQKQILLNLLNFDTEDRVESSGGQP